MCRLCERDDRATERMDDLIDDDGHVDARIPDTAPKPNERTLNAFVNGRMPRIGDRGDPTVLADGSGRDRSETEQGTLDAFGGKR